MSILTYRQANAFLTALRGKNTVFLFHDKETKVQVSSFILRCAFLLNTQARILDTDVFYCTNIKALAEKLDVEFLEKTMALLPQGKFTQHSLVQVLQPEASMLILDSLNSIYSLTSNRSQIRKLITFMKLLSWWARSNRSWVIATAYRGDWIPAVTGSSQRSLTSLGDLLVEAEYQDNILRFKPSPKECWPNGEFAAKSTF